MFFARKRSGNEAAAAPMLVTEALPQDVMLLAFVSPRSRPAFTPINLYAWYTFQQMLYLKFGDVSFLN